jgi:hypothetical protein
MNSEQEKELLKYLFNLGFSGRTFEDELLQKISKDTPNFRLLHTVTYGDDKMLFDMRFAKDHQFDAYRLDSYEATLRRSPVIEDLDINGINTRRLEQSFKETDWNKYFNDRKGNQSRGGWDSVRSILTDLWQLTAEPSAKGVRIQDQLQFKYWPEAAWDDAARDLKKANDISRSFSVSEYGCCSADLAYNIMSGKLDDLHEKLMALEIDQYPGFDLYRTLEDKLTKTLYEFEIRLERNDPEGYIEFIIPLTLVDGYYSCEGYQAILIPHLPIEHGLYNGIDSRELEDQMAQIDWHDDKRLFTFEEDVEPKFTPKVADIQEQLFRLSKDMAGADIADRLQLKYWSDATFFEGVLLQSAWDLLDTLPKRQQQFSLDITAKAACNLLHGRAVLNHPRQKIDTEELQWVRLDLDNKKGGVYKTVTIDGFNKSDLELQLHMLAFSNAGFYPVRSSLVHGDIVAVTRENGMIIKVEANPEERTLNIYTTDMQKIPVNLRLDPDWRPSLQEFSNAVQQEIRKAATGTKSKTTQSLKRNKGRSL